jgi:hypothetical protein
MELVRRLRVGALVLALACSRTGADEARADADAAAPACAARAGEACCASPDGALACGAGLACAGARCTCLAQVTAVYDTTPLARRVDGSVWVAADRVRFTEILGPAGRLHATDIAASGSTAYGSAVGCALVEGGAVWCFPLAGPVIDSTDLGAGLGPGVTTTAAVQVVTSAGPAAPPLLGATQLSATMNGGGAAFCAVAGGGEIWCWGYGANRILGRGDDADSSFAQPVMRSASGAPFTDAAEVRLGFDSACARTTFGEVWCWGDNSLGQTGLANTGGLPGDVTSFPAGPVPLPLPPVRLAANPGKTHCAILSLGDVACWGWNEYEQAGSDSGLPFVTPTQVLSPTQVLPPPLRDPLANVVDLAPDRGMQAMCATTGDGALVCWGHPFAPPGGADALSALPVTIPVTRGGEQAPLLLPLSSYGGRDGALVYVDPDGQLTLEAGGFPFAAQPPCDDAAAP